jgi:hypothetical protein
MKEATVIYKNNRADMDFIKAVSTANGGCMPSMPFNGVPMSRGYGYFFYFPTEGECIRFADGIRRVEDVVDVEVSDFKR